MSVDYEVHDLGNVVLQRGATIRDCKLAYKTFGKLNAAKDNVIVYPTWYSGQHVDNEWLVGSGMALDPSIAEKDSLFAGNSTLSIAPAPGAPFLAVTPQDGLDKLSLTGGVSYETPALFVRGDVAGDATLDPAQWLASARGTSAKGEMALKAEVAVKLPE